MVASDQHSALGSRTIGLEAIAVFMGLQPADIEHLDPERLMRVSPGLTLPRSAILKDLFCAACIRQGSWNAAGNWLRRRGTIDLSPPIELIRSDGFLTDLTITALDDAIVQAAIDEALP